MFSISKLTHPPTGVEHALTCYFFNRLEKSLVIAGANLIRVYRFMPDIDNTKKHLYSGTLCDIIFGYFVLFKNLCFCVI